MSEETETERGELTCMLTHTQEEQRQDLNQGAWLRAHVPPLCMPYNCRAEAWLFAGDRGISIITIPILGLLGTAQSSCFNLFNPKNNTHKEILLLLSPPFYSGATQSTERLNNFPDITWPVELDFPAI